MKPLEQLLTAALQWALDSELEPKWLNTLLTTLPKPGKSTGLAKYLRPILVVGTWYSLIMWMFVTCLKVGLHDVLPSEQHAYCPG